MSDQNKTLARRWFEDLFSRGDLDAANEILSVEFVDHLPREEERGIVELKHYVSIFRSAFPNIEDTVEDIVAEADKVVVRWRSWGTSARGEGETGETWRYRDAPVPHCRKQDSRKLGEHRRARPAGAA